MEGTAQPADGAPPTHVQALRDEVDGLRTVLESGAVIEQAKGVLMAKLGCDADRASALLRSHAERESRPIVDIAEELVTAQRRR